MVQQLISLEEIGTRRQGKHNGGIAQKYVLSEQGRRLLLERYDGRTETIDELMPYFPGIPRYAVRKWARDLGLARQKEPRWTTEEMDYLERNLSKKSLKDIGKHLGRTRTAVHLKAKRLDLKKTEEGYTLRGLMLGLGLTNHHKVYDWVNRGWLKGTRRHTERSDTGDIWYFTDAAIRRFVKEHPHEIDPRRADWLWLVDVLVGGLGTFAQEKDL